MKQLTLINPENVSEHEVKSYTERKAVRAVVIDENKLIALLHVSKEGYYKLPGGGTEGSEDRITALRRECKEEIGCDIEVVQEIGVVIEYRKMFHLKQTSYCFLAKVKGQKGKPGFMEDEIAEGFREAWLPYEKALQAIIQSKAKSFEASAYMVPRDIFFLKAVREYLASVKIA